MAMARERVEEWAGGGVGNAAVVELDVKVDVRKIVRACTAHACLNRNPFTCATRHTTTSHEQRSSRRKSMPNSALLHYFIVTATLSFSSFSFAKPYSYARSP